MRSNNGWYSVFDTEHRPESGEEVLCLGMLDGALRDEDPLANQNNRVYFIATWYNKGDPILDEEPDLDDCDSDEERLMRILEGTYTPAPEDGFYTKEPELRKRKDTRGGMLEPYAIYLRNDRLTYASDGKDGLIAWKPLDWPTED